MGGFPSGQREQTVNLLSVTSVVRIHPSPPRKPHYSVRFFFFVGVVYSHPLLTRFCALRELRTQNICHKIRYSVAPLLTNHGSSALASPLNFKIYLIANINLSKVNFVKIFFKVISYYL